jgi:L-serine/L-threonine ammonia-lyase
MRAICQVWYKLENLQPSGSFKNRGTGHFCEVLAGQPGVSGFAISSGGNAGMLLSPGSPSVHAGDGCVVWVRCRKRMISEQP